MQLPGKTYLIIFDFLTFSHDQVDISSLAGV